ncbi:MAG TPA: DUF4476 domain-containing protein [Bacteroidales bacterium]|nr:DUF4476 domain-containing protein [Bacteroidales bacterium]HPS16980.1 DUF4476 domain-containing protein [Bacteroidales bacterium]
MKNLIFTLALCFSILSLSAHPGISELHLKLYNNCPFFVKIDNVPYNNISSAFKLNLKPGKHSLSVFVLNHVGFNTVPIKIFSGKINIIPNMKIYSIISRHGHYKVIYQINRLNPDDSYNNDGFEYGNFSEEGYNDDMYSEPDNTPYSISDADFISCLSTINNSTFESSKVKIATEAINSNYFTSTQILQILKCFTFESSKLEIAKLAYQKVIDKENFFKVNEAFSFDSSIDELSKFIAG